MIQNDSILLRSLEVNVDSIDRNVEMLQYKLGVLQDKVDMLSNIVSTANDGVSSQLTAANILLVIVGVVMAVVGVWLSFYVGKKKSEVEHIERIIEEKKKKIDIVAKTTKELDRKINNDIESLYKRLRHEETRTLLERLVQEPRDFPNIGGLLFARDINDEFFKLLKEAYVKLLSEKYEDNKKKRVDLGLYLGLIFQHFTYLALRDDEIRPNLIKEFGCLCDVAFQSDIIKSTRDLCRALSDETSSFKKEETLVAYLKAINESKYKNFDDLRNILEQNITPQTLLKNAIDCCTNEKCYLQIFGLYPPIDEKGRRVQ